MYFDKSLSNLSKIGWAFFMPFFLLQTLYASSLELSISSYPSRLNPLLATDSASGEISSWVFNGLLKYDKHGKIIADLAENFYFEDNLTLIVKLKKNITWHDGQAFNADDVLFTFETLRSPDIFTPYTSGFRNVDKVIKINDYTLKITHTKPYFKALETWMMGIIPKHLLENEKDLMTATFNQHPIGTGSYKIDGFEVSKDIFLEANPSYFEHRANIQTLNYHYVQDPSTEFLMLKGTQLDLGSLTPMQIERQITPKFKQFYNIIEQPSRSYTYLGFNLERPPFDNPKVREAISLAIDRQELVDILFFGHGKVCHGPFLEGAVGFNKNITSPKHDINKSQAILKSLGYDKKNPLKFTIKTNSNNPTRKYAVEVLQHQLRQAGIEVTINLMEWQAFLNRAVHAKDFDAIVLGWALSFMPDPYSIWHSDNNKKGGYNFIGYHNPKVDQLITQSETMIDRDTLDTTFQEIYKLIVQDNPYLFLYIPNSITVVNKNITPIEPTLLGIMHNQIDWIKP
jgi:peptide/nickel transport system substrate-binding protein